MNCTKCGKEFTPLSCPSCGNLLDTGTCPACNEGQRITCGACGQELEIARVDSTASEGTSTADTPPGSANVTTGEAPPPPQRAETDSPHGAPPPATASNVPPSLRDTPVQNQIPPAYTQPPQGQAAPPPHYNQPPQGQAAPPPHYNQPPQGQAAPPPFQGAPGQGYPPPPAYGVPGQQGYQQPPYGAPYPPVPRQKVSLGGWLLCYFVFAIIGLVFSGLGFINNLITFSWISAIISAVCSLLPLIMIIYFINKRNMKFFIWYRILAIIGFVSAGIMVVFSVVGRDYLTGLMNTTLSSLPADYYEAFSFSYGYSVTLSEIIVNYVVAVFIVAAVIMVAWYLAWWIYFIRSKRVAYTFDPRNNPPT